MRSRGDVLIAIIMCVIKPSALLAIRMAAEHGWWHCCYCLLSSYGFVHPAAHFPTCNLLRTIQHRYVRRIWQVQAYLYFRSNLTFQFRHIVSFSYFFFFGRCFWLFWVRFPHLIFFDWCRNSNSIFIFGWQGIFGMLTTYLPIAIKITITYSCSANTSHHISFEMSSLSHRI